MLTIIEAVEFLNLCPICPDIQNKILMLFIGINGTPTSTIIKLQIKCLNNSFKSSLFKKFILENDLTLWFLKLYLNKAINLNKLDHRNGRKEIKGSACFAFLFCFACALKKK